MSLTTGRQCDNGVVREATWCFDASCTSSAAVDLTGRPAAADLPDRPAVTIASAVFAGVPAPCQHSPGTARRVLRAVCAAARTEQAV